MRIPAGAPVPFWLSVKNKLPKWAKVNKPTLGTMAVVATAIVTFSAVAAVTFYPKYYHDYYQKAQKEERALLRSSREQQAGPQNVWIDPFERK
uniref:Small integral membrane protein 20 n=1 Tax=Caenorhabditis tropicalis TaxID=1561998 RepID=A0A1I7T7H0_9PELO